MKHYSYSSYDSHICQHPPHEGTSNYIIAIRTVPGRHLTMLGAKQAMLANCLTFSRERLGQNAQAQKEVEASKAKHRVVTPNCKLTTMAPRVTQCSALLTSNASRLSSTSPRSILARFAGIINCNYNTTIDINTTSYHLAAVDISHPRPNITQGKRVRRDHRLSSVESHISNAYIPW